jgi:hypothetical protein
MSDDTQPASPAPAEQTPGATASTPVDTGASATPSAIEAGAETPDDNAEGEKPKKRNRDGRVSGRFKELTNKVKERDRVIAELTAKAAGTAAGEAPKRESFANYEDFVEAKAAYAAEQAFERKERERAEQRSADAKTERLSAFQSEMAAEAAADPAFAKAWQVVSADNFPVSPAMGDFIAESDDPASLIEYLASNHDEAKRLYRASPHEVARALARVEAKLVSAPPARTPQAPPPPPTVGGRSTPRVDLARLASQKDAEAYIEARRKQMGA